MADSWDPKADDAEGLQCKVYGAASVMRMPGRLNHTLILRMFQEVIVIGIGRKDYFQTARRRGR